MARAAWLAVWRNSVAIGLRPHHNGVMGGDDKCAFIIRLAGPRAPDPVSEALTEHYGDGIVVLLAYLAIRGQRGAWACPRVMAPFLEPCTRKGENVREFAGTRLGARAAS